MSITITKGNMFDLNCDALVNPINCKGVMGAGLALEFKKRYPAMFTEYVKLCKASQIQIGKVWIWETGLLIPPLYLINFPTKDDWRNPSKLKWIESGLDDLRSHVILNEMASIALPALGCGKGNLSFDNVRPLIELKLGDLKTNVFLFEPQ